MKPSDTFYEVGKEYKIVGYKDTLKLVDIDDTYAKFIWMGGLKYHIVKSIRIPSMYKKVTKQ